MNTEHLDGYSAHAPPLTVVSTTYRDIYKETDLRQDSTDRRQRTHDQAGVNLTPYPGAVQQGAWQASEGERLENILRRWAGRAGVNLIWQAENTYALQAPFTQRGSFQEAVLGLLENFSNQASPPAGRLHVDKSGQPLYLIIEDV